MSSFIFLLPFLILLIVLIPYFMDSGLTARNAFVVKAGFLKFFLMSKSDLDSASKTTRAYRHIAIYMPTILSLIFVLIFSYIFPDKQFAYYSIFFALAIIFLIYLCFCSVNYSLRSIFISLLWSLFLNIFYFYSYISLFGAVFAIVDGFSDLKSNSNIIIFAITTVFFCLHVLVAAIHSRWKSTIVLMLYGSLAIFMFSIFPGASRLGSLALRNAEIGGGLPARIFIRKADSEARNLLSNIIVGCVIVNTGRFIILEEFIPRNNEDDFISNYCRDLSFKGEVKSDLKSKHNISVYGYGEIINIRPIIRGNIAPIEYSNSSKQ